jgi:predicted DNA-binding protein
MKRTTIKLPDDVDAKLRNEAARRGVAISDITREAIEEHLGITPRRRFFR